MDTLASILQDRKLAQFGDSLLNFGYSLALTRSTKKPVGVKVKDKTLADAAVIVGLRKHLGRRVNVGDVANSLEALVGHVWLKDLISLDEIVTCLVPETIDPTEGFVKLGRLALERLTLDTRRD